MAKLAIYLASFALVLFLANASITTVIVDEENPWGRRGGPEESCQTQIMEQDRLRHCQSYMEEQWGSSSRRYNNRRDRQNIDMCCQQLEKLNTQCRCPGLRYAAKQQMETERIGREEMQEMSDMADRIMSKCEMEPRRCDWPSRDMF